MTRFLIKKNKRKKYLLWYNNDVDDDHHHHIDVEEFRVSDCFFDSVFNLKSKLNQIFDLKDFFLKKYP